MFIKRGDVKIISIVPEEEVSEDQKKSIKDLSKDNSNKSKEVKKEN